MPTPIGIRREDINRWERRAPVIPSHVRELRQEQGLEFIVQPSDIRVFRNDDYRLEGGTIQEGLSDCGVILAIKEIPLPLIEPGKTYLFFSHTIKGQAHNMPMLRKFVEQGCTLIDYEKITDDQGRRLVFFGKQAGEAGMVDTLWALSRRLDIEGTAHPFSGLVQMFHYTSLVEAKEKIAEIGHKIRTEGLPPVLAPLIIGFTGYGHVSQGAQEILDLLPVEEIPAERFGAFLRRGPQSPYRVYKTVFREEHLVRPKDPRRLFDLQDYYQNPGEYEPLLHAYLPHLTVLINGIYWEPKYPRFVTKSTLRGLFAPGAAVAPRLRIIGDISCDVEGGVECTLKATDPENPIYVYDPAADTAIDGAAGNGPVIMAVYNLPAEIPLESSVFFSQSLKPFVPALARADFRAPFEALDLPAPIKRAVLLHRGRFTPSYAYMEKFLER